MAAGFRIQDTGAVMGIYSCGGRNDIDRIGNSRISFNKIGVNEPGEEPENGINQD